MLESLLGAKAVTASGLIYIPLVAGDLRQITPPPSPPLTYMVPAVIGDMLILDDNNGGNTRYTPVTDQWSFGGLATPPNYSRRLVSIKDDLCSIYATLTYVWIGSSKLTTFPSFSQIGLLNIPGGETSHQITTVGRGPSNKLYIQTYGLKTGNKFLSFDMITRLWGTLTIPGGVGGTAYDISAVGNNKLYGNVRNAGVYQLGCYDIASNTWTYINYPTAGYRFTAANNRYVYALLRIDANNSKLEAYDTEEGVWLTIKESIPVAWTSMVVIKGHIFIVTAAGSFYEIT